jgi:hypothetical protein
MKPIRAISLNISIMLIIMSISPKQTAAQFTIFGSTYHIIDNVLHHERNNLLVPVSASPAQYTKPAQTPKPVQEDVQNQPVQAPEPVQLPEAKAETPPLDQNQTPVMAAEPAIITEETAIQASTFIAPAAPIIQEAQAPIAPIQMATIASMTTIASPALPTETEKALVLPTSFEIPFITQPRPNTLTPSTVQTIEGRSEQNAMIGVFIDGTLAGTTTANKRGLWSFVSDSLNYGPHTVYAIGIVNNNISPNSTTVNFIITSPKKHLALKSTENMQEVILNNKRLAKKRSGQNKHIDYFINFILTHAKGKS